MSTKPRIINVYQLNYKDHKGHIGLGDFIKGSIYLLTLCNKHGYDFGIDIRNHPMAKYFTVADTPIPDYKSITMWSANENYVPPIKTCYYTCCRRSHLPKNFDRNTLVKIKSFLLPTEQLINNIDCIITNFGLTKKSFDIIHLRTGDTALFSQHVIATTKLIERKLLKTLDITKQYIILSDNAKLKQYLEKYPNFHTNSTSTILHTGRANGNDDYLDSITDFFLMSHANKIWSFSIYVWGSGFSECASVLYNVPLVKISIEPVSLFMQSAFGK